MSTILIVSFILAIMLVAKFNFNTIVNMVTDYSGLAGVIEKNLGKGKYSVRIYNTPWVSTTVNAHSTNEMIPAGTTVTLEKESMLSYRVYCWISMDPDYFKEPTDFEKHMYYCNEVSKKIEAEKNNG